MGWRSHTRALDAWANGTRVDALPPVAASTLEFLISGLRRRSPTCKFSAEVAAQIHLTKLLVCLLLQPHARRTRSKCMLSRRDPVLQYLLKVLLKTSGGQQQLDRVHHVA